MPYSWLLRWPSSCRATSSQANLVSAIRLPNNLFTDNAGTEVGSDLIVLQKNLSKKEMSQDGFLSILLTGLYECETKEEEHYCFLHPGKKHKCLRNKYTKYCADMNVLLAYYNLLDDWEDEKNYAAFTAAKALKKSVTRIEASYPRQTKAVQDYLEKLHACEKENNPDLDLAAGYTGEVMAEIYIPEEDIWSDDLRQVGFYIGKFIYLMDALDDVEKDKKSGNYNPFLSIADQPDFEETAEKILLMMTAEASRAFEKLPILENVDILRNILYAGIWEKYEMRKSAKERQKEEK